MARSNKSPKKPPQPKNSFEQYDFINYRLADTEKQACEAWCTSYDATKALHVLAELAADGYKVSVSYSSKIDAAVATITNNDGPVDFQKKVLSIRAADGYQAVLRIFWLHFVLADGDWGNLTQNMPDDIW